MGFPGGFMGVPLGTPGEFDWGAIVRPTLMMMVVNKFLLFPFSVFG